MVIGFRSFTDGFAYVILDGTQPSPIVIAKDRITLPKNQTRNAQLSWVRKQIAEIAQGHEIKGACIKIIEHNARKKSVERMQIEAILREFIYSALSIECIERVKSQLKRDIIGFTEPARYLEHVLTEKETLAELNGPQFQDATLAAVSELPVE